MASASATEEAVHASRRWETTGLAVVLLAFGAYWIVPVLKRTGSQDEQLFSVPGYTVAMEGIPRIPYLPSRNREGVFYRADETVFALPPALFYAQAPFFLVLPAGYPTSRVPSLLAGLAAIWLVHQLARKHLHAGGIALGIAVLYGFSRPVYFPATIARPDMLCGALGLCAVALVWRWTESRSPVTLALAGATLGLGMLTHPFAIVFCVQMGGWVLVSGESARGRLRSFSILTAAALCVFALWVPLILTNPDVFKSQFFNNVLSPAGGGLGRRILWPLPSLWHQAQSLWDYAGPYQGAMLALSLATGTAALSRNGPRVTRTFVALAWSALLLQAMFQGEHSTKGYWCYAVALLWLAGGAGLAHLTATLTDRRRNWVTTVAVALAALLLMPQSGARMWVESVRHWGDVDYDGPRFAQRMLADLPAEGHYLVGPDFVFDFYLAGRDVRLNTDPAGDYRIPDAEYRYDYLIVSRIGIEAGLPGRLNGRLLRSYGDRDNPFGCFAEVYVPHSDPP